MDRMEWNEMEGGGGGVDGVDGMDLDWSAGRRNGPRTGRMTGAPAEWNGMEAK